MNHVLRKQTAPKKRNKTTSQELVGNAKVLDINVPDGKIHSVLSVLVQDLGVVTVIPKAPVQDLFLWRGLAFGLTRYVDLSLYKKYTGDMQLEAPKPRSGERGMLSTTLVNPAFIEGTIEDKWRELQEERNVS